MIVFDRRAGTLANEAGVVFQRGVWSGHGDAFNDPDREQEPGVGPIPAGIYIIGPMRDSPRLGPHVMNLDPMDDTDTFGRSLFRIHGDTANDTDHSASDGCIIAPRGCRDFINTLGDRRLKVI